MCCRGACGSYSLCRCESNVDFLIQLKEDRKNKYFPKCQTFIFVWIQIFTLINRPELVFLNGFIFFLLFCFATAYYLASAKRFNYSMVLLLPGTCIDGIY